MSQSPAEPLVAACGQLCSTADFDANLDACKRLAEQAAARGARLLVLPECFAFLGEHERDKFAVAEILDAAQPGRTLGAVQTWAREHDLWIVAGGIPELSAGTERQTATTAFNTCAVVSPAGDLVATYRKIHLFDVDIPGGATLKESASTTPGSDVQVVDTPVGRMGLSICYDVRFPELYRQMTLELGAEILVVPAAFTAHTGAAHWHTLLRARAIENQCWVLAAAQTGRHNAKRASFGHSMIIDPWGVVRGELAEGQGIVSCAIDREFTAQKRAQLPCLSHSVLGTRSEK